MQTSLFEREAEKLDLMRPLRPRQLQAISAIKEAIRDGHKRIILQAPTGFGKTLTSAHIIASALQKGSRPLFTCPAITLVDQTLAAFEREGIHDIGVMQASHARTNHAASVQIASVQTLIRRARPDVTFVMIDECFPAGTMITTARGLKPIEKIVPGEVIPNALGIGRVLSLFRKSHNHFVTVRLSDGTSFRCTPEHPIFTLSGWKKAGELEIRQRVFREEDVSILRSGVRSLYHANGHTCRKAGSRSAVRRAGMLLELLCQEATESYVTSRNPRTSVTGSTGYGAQAKSPGRKRKASAGDSVAGVGYIGRRVVSRTGGEDSPQATDVPALLQDGLSEPGIDDRDRVGWWEPFVAYAAGTRSEEGCASSLVWVESVEAEELPRAEPVYNLRVAGHPSYFANGILVHNCHETFEALNEMLDSEEWRDIIVIGLSATPWTRGLGLRWTKLIVGDTMRDMINEGYAREFTIYGPPKDIDRENLKVSQGDFDEASSSAAMSDATIVGDVLTEWKERSTRDKTFAFCVNRDHAKAQMEAFQDCGIPFGYIDANIPAGVSDSERGTRKHIFAQMRNGEIAGIASVGCLIRGVDEIVYNILDLQPTKSEMRHCQKWGRMRTSDPDATYIGFDHAGNNQNLGVFWDIHHDTLDMREPGDRDEAYKEDYKAAKPRKCPKCHTLVPAGARTCPTCSERLPLHAGVTVKDGRLVEIKPKPKPTKEQQAWFSEFVWLGKKAGFKEGWPAMQFKEKFGVMPFELAGMKTRGKNPTPEVKQFVREKRKEYLASKSRVAAAKIEAIEMSL